MIKHFKGSLGDGAMVASMMKQCETDGCADKAVTFNTRAKKYRCYDHRNDNGINSVNIFSKISVESAFEHDNDLLLISRKGV